MGELWEKRGRSVGEPWGTVEESWGNRGGTVGEPRGNRGGTHSKTTRGFFREKKACGALSMLLSFLNEKSAANQKKSISFLANLSVQLR